ncbi:MAG: hypothetical protein K0S53_2686 [Bacteroidetes bacterium]|jgi:hypothetical protein|nr:hypothetical protein [Bacteroidota bacterium]
MDKLLNIEPTLIDPDSIESYDPLQDCTSLLNAIQKWYDEEHTKLLHSRQVFTDEKASFRDPVKTEKIKVPLTKEELAARRKIVIAIIVGIIMCIIIFLVVKKHNRLKKEEQTEREATKSAYVETYFSRMRKTDLGLKIIIAGESSIYICGLFVGAYMVKAITKQADDALKS